MSDTERALHAIRVAELDAARRFEQARADAAELVGAAHQEHSRAIGDAEQRGRVEAERRFATAVAAAEEEAEATLAGGDARIESLRRAAEPHLATAAIQMVDLLLAPPLEKGK